MAKTIKRPIMDTEIDPIERVFIFRNDWKQLFKARYSDSSSYLATLAPVLLHDISRSVEKYGKYVHGKLHRHPSGMYVHSDAHGMLPATLFIELTIT